MLLAEYVVTNVAVCLACSASRAERPGGVKLVCGESGERFELHARAGQQAQGKWPCPRGKHADDRGRVVALTVGGIGVLSRGAGWSQRVKLEVTDQYPGAMEKLPGCGCYDALKRVAELFKAWCGDWWAASGIEGSRVKSESSPVTSPRFQRQLRLAPGPR